MVDATVLSLNFFLIFFLTFTFENDSRKITENFSEGSSISEISRKTKGYNGRKMHEKKTPTGPKKSNPPKVFYTFFRIKLFALLRLKSFVL